jgi:N utilization substance protein A
MNSQLLAVVQHIENERGVSREIVLQAIEQAISQAARKNRDVTNDLRVVIDRKDLSLHVFDTLVASDEDTGPGFISIARATRANHGNPVKEGDTIEVEMPASRLGRIAAQTSRQMIMQKIRDAERTNTFSEYKDRVGDIVSGTVSAVSHRDTYVTVGKVEMILPAKERIPTEDYQVGDPIRAIVLRVDPEAHGPSVILSRASGKFVEALFRLEVSEIADGVVEIMGVSRDPGFRAKLAVRTSNENVDPVGACVGQRGSRVRTIVNELSGEKIDIVRWNEDIRQYVAQALAPAKLESIEVDPVAPNTVHVVVAADQYSLAIGKRGQNVRLTTKLTGWHIEVRKSMATASFEDQKTEAIKDLADTL